MSNLNILSRNRLLHQRPNNHPTLLIIQRPKQRMCPNRRPQPRQLLIRLLIKRRRPLIARRVRRVHRLRRHRRASPHPVVGGEPIRRGFEGGRRAVAVGRAVGAEGVCGGGGFGAGGEGAGSGAGDGVTFFFFDYLVDGACGEGFGAALGRTGGVAEGVRAVAAGEGVAWHLVARSWGERESVCVCCGVVAMVVVVVVG